MKQPDPRLKNFTAKKEILTQFMKTFGIMAADIVIIIKDGTIRQTKKGD